MRAQFLVGAERRPARAAFALVGSLVRISISPCDMIGLPRTDSSGGGALRSADGRSERVRGGPCCIRLRTLPG